jgi:hypothetical protein
VTAFDSCIAQPEERQFMESARDEWEKKEGWLKLTRYGKWYPRYKLWGESPEELSMAANEIILGANNEPPNWGHPFVSVSLEPGSPIMAVIRAESVRPARFASTTTCTS